ncbi:MAG TPA: G1 family glutamic endopeptidase [Streptosporangiaceae bacterium]|jgi:hypothetical protein|nr:G1 family glutamic endopeptidase [Streptosporangiaceae bacterium]
MKGRTLAGVTICAVSVALLGLPAAASASAKPAAPSSTGSRAYLQKLLARGEKECIQPPAHLSIKTMTDAQLALLGLPGRPALEHSPAKWSHLLAHYKHRACGTRPAPPGPKFRNNLAGPKSPDTSGSGSNWAGNYSVAARGTFREVWGTWNVAPSSTSGDNYGDAATWVGVGGVVGVPGVSGNSFGLIQAGVSTEIEPKASGGGTWLDNYAWYEMVNPQCSLNDCYPITMNLPDLYPNVQITTIVTSNYGGDDDNYFDVCNNTYSTCEATTVSGSYGLSDSATGECIVEEPNNPTFADFGSQHISDCDVNGSEPVGGITHDYTYINSYCATTACNSLKLLGGTQVDVGSTTNGGANYPLYFCDPYGSGNSCS